MRHNLLITAVVINLVVGKLFPAAGSEPPAQLRVEIAPLPHEPAERISSEGIKSISRPADTDETVSSNGVEWRVNAKVRRLVSSGREVIDLDWRIKYTGPRPPLIILAPSLTDSWPETTEVCVIAFAKGCKDGRGELFQTPEPADGLLNVIFQGDPKEWYITVDKNQTATGTVTLSVADLKRVLLRKFPTEFSETIPPKLYVKMRHQPKHRGEKHEFDAWSGDLPSLMLELPALNKW